MILISLLAHEKPDVLLDQVANFKKFAPQAALVIHLSRPMLDASPEASETLRQCAGVWVNTESFYTGVGMVLKCHVSNFLYAEKTGITFSHFCLHSSNDLFVRKGVEAYVTQHQFGFFQYDIFTEKFGFSLWEQDFLADRIYRKIMRRTGSEPTHYVSQVEGTFYPREAFGDFARLFFRVAWRELGWPINYIHGNSRSMILLAERFGRRPRLRKYLGQYFYPKEEFYPANYFSTWCARPAAPYCYMNWASQLQVTPADVEMIRCDKVPQGDYQRLYSVKRVNRDMSDPLRQMISTLA